MIYFSIVVVKYHNQEELTEESILAFGSRRKEVVHNDGEGMPTRDHSRKLGYRIFKNKHKAEKKQSGNGPRLQALNACLRAVVSPAFLTNGFLVSPNRTPAVDQVCKYLGPQGIIPTHHMVHIVKSRDNWVREVLSFPLMGKMWGEKASKSLSHPLASLDAQYGLNVKRPSQIHMQGVWLSVGLPGSNQVLQALS